MKTRTIALCCVMLLTSLWTTACWNRRELNELSIVMAMGIDQTKNGFLITIQMVNAQEIASKGGSGYSTPITVYHAEGDTIFEALRRLTSKIGREVYLSHIRVIVIGEALARKGIAEVLDFLSRDHEIRTDFYMTVARESRAEEVLKILTPEEKIPANKMFSTLEVSQRNWAVVSKVTIDNLLSNILSEGSNPVLTGIQVNGDPEVGRNKQSVEMTDPEVIIQYIGMAAFQKDKLVGWLNEDESKGLNYTLGKVKRTVINVACPQGGKVAVQLIRTDRKIKATVSEGEPTILIELKAEGNIGDVECQLDVTDVKALPEIQKEIEDSIHSKIQAVVNKSQQKLKTDILGLGEALHRDQPKLWKQLKENWQQSFVDLHVDIEVNAKIRRIGTVAEPILKKKEG
ncbi:Ger(x)C family spore germination protein [Paenibacillus agricola]|uniref:Ger(X)C family spore germination protein n=1 Tax=Paenibacillus agricola TaxID=2716264 RepID=A0ABX0J3V3_9BACL|nr:Ger(x)C family spore germination protein [Paenibacillus agricola]NHN30668.1 Ger(x)C family spore germination protein [Paenibacillus agricola]